ncbi:MAG: glycosyltransferase family 4 protein [Chitinophagaceae bacterium]|nr:glycosyltransferase family 4 protein [Chitinophagaceae bacterium]
MKVAFITRSTLHKVPGGDSIQVLQTARHLSELGIEVDILLTNVRINYSHYDLFHFSNIIRPSDILFHVKRIRKPYFISPLLVDYSEYDKLYRKGFSGFILKNFSPFTNEYIKTIGRWIVGKDKLQSKNYIWKGQRRSMKEIVNGAAAILPNSATEGLALKKMFGVEKPSFIIPSGIDTTLFTPDKTVVKDDKLILCAARIEGIKNQLNLIKALNNTSYTLMLIGAAAPNQKKYYTTCCKEAASNVVFLDHIPQHLLIDHYKKAKVHVLPSWFETCGLSSLEAAAMGCNIVITDKGYTRDYFSDDAFYCDPADPSSILNAIEMASQNKASENLMNKIQEQYTWQHTAAATLDVYKKFI